MLVEKGRKTTSYDGAAVRVFVEGVVTTAQHLRIKWTAYSGTVIL